MGVPASPLILPATAGPSAATRRAFLFSGTGETMFPPWAPFFSVALCRTELALRGGAAPLRATDRSLQPTGLDDALQELLSSRFSRRAQYLARLTLLQDHSRIEEANPVRDVA